MHMIAYTRTKAYHLFFEMTLSFDNYSRYNLMLGDRIGIKYSMLRPCIIKVYVLSI